MAHSNRPTHDWRLRAGGLACWLFASTMWGFLVLEFSVAVDGYGHGYLETPTFVSLGFLGASVVFACGVSGVWARRRSESGALIALGFVLWLVVVWIGAFFLPLQYSAVCGDVSSEHICARAWYVTKQQRRNACLLGDTQSCRALMSLSATQQTSLCAQLERRCVEPVAHETGAARPDAFKTCATYQSVCGERHETVRFTKR